MINERRAFGDRLRRHRERHNVTLAHIAETTKVAASLFAGLERGDCSRWPGGVYNRAFVRGYAVAVQLDPDEVTTEFVEYYEAPADAPVPVATRKADAPARPPLRLGLELDPTESWRRVFTATAVTVADLGAIAVLTGLVVLGTGAPVWNALAMTGVGYHALARIAGYIPRANRPWVKSGIRPGLEPLASDDEVPVSSTASTIA